MQLIIFFDIGPRTSSSKPLFQCKPKSIAFGEWTEGIRHYFVYIMACCISGGISHLSEINRVFRLISLDTINQVRCSIIEFEVDVSHRSWGWEVY